MDELSSRLNTPQEKIMSKCRYMQNNSYSIIAFMERPKRDTSELNCLEINT